MSWAELGNIDETSQQDNLNRQTGDRQTEAQDYVLCQTDLKSLSILSTILEYSSNNLETFEKYS